MANGYKIFKRAFDFTVALLGVLLLWPVLLLIGVAVKLDSNGPIFFLQKRVTENEKTFVIIKFRSMVENARKTQFEKNISPNQLFTRLGGKLRDTHLDELPQLANIFLGKMSVIGPRPLIAENELMRIEKKPLRKKRYKVKVGVSGIERLVDLMPDRKKKIFENLPNAKHLKNAKDKLDYDLYYVENVSAKVDFLLILETVRLILRKLKQNLL